MAARLTVTLKPDSNLLKDNLYQLEQVFGRSTGHGCGVEGEDIHFPFPGGDRRGELSLNRRQRQLTIRVARWTRDNWQDIALSEIPEPMRGQLIAVLREHAQEPIPVEVFQ